MELVVLARYMPVLNDELTRCLNGRAINIHHSFLPSFKGANRTTRRTREGRVILQGNRTVVLR